MYTQQLKTNYYVYLTVTLGWYDSKVLDSSYLQHLTSSYIRNSYYHLHTVGRGYVGSDVIACLGKWTLSLVVNG